MSTSSHKGGRKGGKKVKLVLLRRDISQSELARRLGIRRPHLNMVVNGRRKTPWIRKAIAHELNLPVEKLFTEELSEDRARDPGRGSPTGDGPRGG